MCWQDIHFITEPFCYKCGLPFSFALGAGALCGECLKKSPAYTQARSVFRYEENSKSQVLAFKYYDKTQLAPVFGTWLARAGADFVPKAEAIIPVPLHYWRLLKGRYNQAALLADALAKRIHVPVLPDTLERQHATPTQAGLTRRQREENMQGVFTVPPKKRGALKGKSVILVDDVMTTGATLNACASALNDAGVVDVYALTLACAVIAE